MKEDQKNKIPEDILNSYYPLIRKPFMPVVTPHGRRGIIRAP